MKKALLLTLILSLITVGIPFNVKAAEAVPADIAAGEYIEYFDGGYIVHSEAYGYDSADAYSISTSGPTRPITKSADSNVYDNNNKLVAVFTLTATFTYNGSTATCTDASYTTKIYDSNWKFTAASAEKASNYAVGTFTVKKTFLFITQATVSDKITITCDRNGNVTVK